MREIYLLSGLGADKRVFDFIDLSGYKLTHVKWIRPGNCESIEDYAARLKRQIITPRPILIGVSFGGMMAIELSRQIDTSLVIIISSARGGSEIPLFLRLLGKVSLNRLVPGRFLKNVTPLTYWLFGARNTQQKRFLKEIIKGTDPTFLKWAIDKILRWKNNATPENLIVIHGTKDRILPSNNPDFEVKMGGHLMIVDRHEEVTSILRTVIDRAL